MAKSTAKTKSKTATKSKKVVSRKRRTPSKKATKLTVNFGSGNITAYQSIQLIGVRLKPSAKTLPKELQKAKEVHRLAGFQVFKVANNRTKCDNILDKVRKSRNVLLGTHVYSLDAKEKSVIVPN